jgi:hypothetical protein
MTRKETSQYFCRNGVNFISQLVVQGKFLDESSGLDVVEIVQVRDILPGYILVGLKNYQYSGFNQ